MKTPFAVLGIRTDGAAVTGVEYLPQDAPQLAARDRVAAETVAQILRYLDDPETPFTVPLAPSGTPFQRRVWDAIRAIPLRESRTYGEVAHAVRSAPRAVGQACGANRIALIIPCHRVVGSRGALGGFMGAAGPSQGARPLGGASRSDVRGERPGAAGPPQGARPLGGASRSDVRGERPGAAGPPQGEPASFDARDPLAIKRWLLRHEGYRFGT